MTTASDSDARGEATLIGVIEGGDALVLASSTLELGGTRHARDHGGRFVLRLDDDSRVTVTAAPQTVEVLPASSRSDNWGVLASDLRASLFSDVAPGDHVKAELAGFCLAPGQRIAVRGVVAGHALEGGGPRETAVAKPSAINARRIAIVESADAQACELLDQAEQADHNEAEARRAREIANNAAAARQAEKVVRPLGMQIIALAVLAVVLVGIGAFFWEGVDAATAGRHSSGFAVLSVMAFVFAFQVVTLLLISLVVRPPFEAARCDEGSSTNKPTWGIGLMSGFFLGIGGSITAMTAFGSAHFGLGALAWPIGFTVLGAFAFLWYARVRHRPQLRLARLLLRARPSPSPLVAGQFGLCTGIVTGDEGRVVERAISWHRRSHTNQSTHGPNAGQTSRWIEGVPRSRSLLSFTCQVGSTSLDIRTKEAEWGAPITYLPASFVCQRAAIEPGDELLVLARPKLEDGSLRARSTGPESLVMFAAPRNARGTLRRLTLGWFLPATALLSIIVVSLAWIVWLIAT